MAPLFTIACFLFLVVETLIGMVANGSIVLIIFIDWLRCKKLFPTDLILICLALSRLLLQAVVILFVTLFTWFNNTFSVIVFMMMGIRIFIRTVNLWLAACLSVFYLVKITIFSHPVFLLVKQRFSGLVPWLLLGSVDFSAVVSIFLMTSWNYAFFTCYNIKPLLSNSSNAEMNMPQVCKHIIALQSVFDFIPFMVFLSSSFFLISSLWNHMRCMQDNATGTRDLNTQAHLSAIKALSSFAILYLISFAAINSQLILLWKNQLYFVTMLHNVSAVYPSGHAIILILINPTLKQAWVRKIHCLKCCWTNVTS